MNTSRHQTRSGRPLRLFAVLLCHALVVALAGCGGGTGLRSASTHYPLIPQQLGPQDLALRAALYEQFNYWQGTPYRYGGMTRQGLDCSAFVLLAFQSTLGVSLPRVTTEQVKVGSPVKRGAWRPGDLVFFRTGGKSRHVGIYLEAERFMHASTSEGVIISSLRNPYWAGAYWQTRRLPARWIERVANP